LAGFFSVGFAEGLLYLVDGMIGLQAHEFSVEVLTV
jgi:hypothetical protein